MKRSTIFKELKAKQKTVIENLKKSINQYKSASDLDEEDTIDPEDFSHQSEAKDMQLRLEQLLKNEQEKLDWLNNHSNLSEENPSTGRLIMTQDYILLLGISMAEIPFENRKLIAVSETAPLYKKVMNLGVGDSFDIGKNKEIVETIL